MGHAMGRSTLMWRVPMPDGEPANLAPLVAYPSRTFGRPTLICRGPTPGGGAVLPACDGRRLACEWPPVSMPLEPPRCLRRGPSRCEHGVSAQQGGRCNAAMQSSTCRSVVLARPMHVPEHC